MRRKIVEFLIESKNILVSGETLSRHLGISRAAVWKHIKFLQKQGYSITCIPGNGYKLTGIPDLIDDMNLKYSLKTKVLGHICESHKIIDSTNTRAKKLALNGAPEGLLVISEQQTAGRGRLNRSWVSPAKKGLWMSLVLKPPITPDRAQEITVITAVSIASTIESYADLKASIKWPNDILIGGKKVCGILAEIQAETDVVNSVILGIGINVNMLTEDFPPELRNTATSLLMETGKAFSRVELLAALLENFENIYYSFLKSDNLSPFLDFYKSRSATLGHYVTITGRTQTYNGLAVDIDKDGALTVKTDDGSMCRVLSGDVTLRRG